ncbi:TonB-dependent receptor [Massilia sp. 9096]|uniref:TonB-dependent receptor n=1 Tax=Massilia sp. 9096 TaxID=1500894 RepID=UPI00055C596C|nr:TonB-dependent receptor [Massilia sp. 9096]
MKFQRTAIAAAVAQIAVLSSNAAWAQQTVDAAQTAGAPQANVVVVSGQRAALQSAQKIKMNSDEVVDSIVAEDIGKLPDRSITEVLSRVVGVTMDRSAQGDPQHLAVEGSGISIRGLSYVASQLNGRESFSAGGGHSLSFSDVPPELMAGVDVYKNPSAENIEGGISGLVNLRTALPFDFKGFKGSLTGSESYSTLRKGAPAPSGSLLLSNRWNTQYGEFGALIDVAKSKTKVRNDEMFVDPYYPHVGAGPNGTDLYIPKGAEWRSQAYDRDRRGDYAAFQWRPTKDVTAALTYFRSRYTEDWSEEALLGQETSWYDMQVANGVFSPTGAFLAGTISDPNNGGINYNTDHRVSDRQSSTQDFSLNVQWRVNSAWTVTNDFQRVMSQTHALDSDVATGIKLPSQTLDLRGDQPTYTFSPSDIAYLANPQNYYWAYTMEHLDRQEADSKAWKTDVKYSFDNPVLRDIRFGVRLQNLNGLNRMTNPSYNWQGITQPWNVGSGNGNITRQAFLGDPRFSGGTELGTFPNFFNGDVKVPAAVFPTDAVARNYPNSYSTLHGYYQALCAVPGTCAAWVPAGFANDPAAVNKQDEKTRAFYTQLRFGFDDLKYPIDGNIGLRYVKTTTNSSGYTVFTPPSNLPSGPNVTGANLVPIFGALATPMAYETNYHNFLPSLNLRLKYNDQLQFRFAVAKSMSRPDFNQLQAYTTLAESVRSTSTGTGTNTQTNVTGANLTGTGTGNPLLKPTTGISEDLTAEWYFAKAGSLTFAVFNKNLHDIVVNTLYNYSLNDTAGQAHNFTVTGPANGAHGYANGIEIAYQQYYDFVPDWLRGIGTQASFTLVNSKRQLNNPVRSAWCTGGAAADNLNLAINGCDTNMQSFGDLPLQGLSRKTVNFAVMYERGPIQTRLAYNWRSRFLLGVNNFGTNGTDAIDLNPNSPTFRNITANNDQAYGLPLYQEAYGQLDGSIFYQFTPKFRIGLEAQNLTNTTVKQTMVQHVGNLGHAWFTTGPRYTVQASYDF